jgi:lysozyme
MSKIVKIGEKGLKLIIFFESFFSKPYICPAGVITIGYGTTRYFDTKFRVKITDKPITEVEALRLLKGDIESIFAPLVDTLCRNDITQNEFDALCSFTYNAGATYRGKDGKNHYYNIYEKVNTKTLTKEYWESLAVTGAGVPLKGLVKRRQKEVELYFTK